MTRTIARFGLATAVLTALGLATAGSLTAQRVSDPFAAVTGPGGGVAPVQLAPETPASLPGHVSVEEVSADPWRPAPQQGFETSGFAQFMASPAGRVLRGAVGVAMIGGGIAMGDTGGTVLAVAGVLPLSAGVLDLCYASALFGGPLRGEEIREAGR
jgi:hypothetical protein